VDETRHNELHRKTRKTHKILTVYLQSNKNMKYSGVARLVTVKIKTLIV
jgi:hypothetical protein